MPLIVDGEADTVWPDTTPDGVRDVWLWQESRRLWWLHRPDPRDPHRCANLACGGRYPCLGRRLAHRAARGASAGWPVSWTIRHDLASCGRAAGVASRSRSPRGPGMAWPAAPGVGHG